MIYLSFLYCHYTTFTCITCWHTFSSFILPFYCIYLLTAEFHVFSWYISFIIWYPYMFLVTIKITLIIITHTYIHTSLYFFVWPVQDSEILVMVCVLCVSHRMSFAWRAATDSWRCWKTLSPERWTSHKAPGSFSSANPHSRTTSSWWP